MPAEPLGIRQPPQQRRFDVIVCDVNNVHGVRVTVGAATGVFVASTFAFFIRAGAQSVTRVLLRHW
jgi:hypothetical protein